MPGAVLALTHLVPGEDIGGGNPLKRGFVKRDYLWSFILVTSLFFLWGFAYGLLDVLNKHFQNVLHITKLQSTGLQVAYFGIGYFAYSPVAGEVLKRRGYKTAIIMGLCLYSLGAILFWPVAKYSVNTKNPHAIFGGFVVCTAVIACGLATLEVAANSYVSVMPPRGFANFRLQFSQSFNGVASFSGPLIASKYFFSGENANNLNNVQWVYLAVAGMGVAIALAFVFTKLPEVSEADLQAQAEAIAHQNSLDGNGHVTALEPFYKQYRAITGFVAQFLYVGAQVTIGSFFLNYSYSNANIPDARGSQLLSYGLITFTVARFIGTALLSYISAPLMLAVYAAVCTVLAVLIGSLRGMPGVVCLIIIMFFESIMYPVIFVLGTSGAGRHTRRASALLVMGVAGGAVFPPIQGAIADKFSTRTSYYLVIPCFVYICGWALWVWNKDGRQLRAGPGTAVPADAESQNTEKLAQVEVLSEKAGEFEERDDKL
ncbi:major facilitator superfamily domain-containing protein [Kockovaella imperatae]|uniref:Major facilitator superfamily domain-containing protein n=1 Tax=Kockovaella imperatae TaxID=4999 RepID=A0A1Y1UIN2_9TREE|nr:major facilitator superfamily domain-containing protein [Kockovaella imperatae]ORX36965.1 major facilitator superfamily domain-containing protein [Kockovaella imperatae]